MIFLAMLVLSADSVSLVGIGDEKGTVGCGGGGGSNVSLSESERGQDKKKKAKSPGSIIIKPLPSPRAKFVKGGKKNPAPTTGTSQTMELPRMHLQGRCALCRSRSLKEERHFCCSL